MVLMAAFASCKKDSSKSDDPADGASVITIEGNYSNKIATIRALAPVYYDDGDYEYSHVIASGKYANGGFKLILPETISEECLRGFTDKFDDFDGTISDPQAKTGDIMIFSYDSKEGRIGRFSYMMDRNNDEEHGGAFYMYADRDFTIKGHNTYYDDDYGYTSYCDEYDCSFTKGWNIMYGIANGYYEASYTTQKPPDVNFKWSYWDYDIVYGYE